ncbi:hypothetical protein F5H01DRAFT_342172 [Linnemannia elongata]|nr:hypothetical protein F5H01DRAFT_342172 [Linnemannia elongata]
MASPSSLSLTPATIVFHIPELLDQLGSHLSRRDITNFCLVNKAWNAVFTPYLWRSVPMATPPYTGHNYTMDLLVRKWNRFLPLVVQDILYEQQQQQRHITSEVENNNNVSVPELSKYGRWIQTLYVDQKLLLIPYSPEPYQVIIMAPGHPAIANATADTAAAVQHHSHRHNHNPNLTTAEILFHLFKRCPNLQTLQIHGQDKLSAEYYFWKTVVTRGFPDSLRELHIILDASISLSKSTILALLLARCPLGLRKLTLDAYYRDYSGRNESSDVDTKEDVVRAPLPALTDLRFELGYRYPPSYVRFLRRCVNLESFYLRSYDTTWAQALRSCSCLERLTVLAMNKWALLYFTSAITSGLFLRLDGFHVLAESDPDSDLEVASVIRACHSGWRLLRLPYIGSLSADALITHCSNLEELEICVADGVTSHQIRQILSFSPRLVKFIMHHRPDGPNAVDRAFISATDFIDLNPTSDTLNPWACESTLKVFCARIARIPRPGVTKVAREEYPGQRNDIQQRVYERLARFTNLERLALGHQSPRGNRSSWIIDLPPDEELLGDYNEHADCLDMTLASGLGRLAGLKKIRKVCVMAMQTSIGIEELKWMGEHWPKLEAVHGLLRNRTWIVTDWLILNRWDIKHSETCPDRGDD